MSGFSTRKKSRGESGVGRRRSRKTKKDEETRAAITAVAEVKRAIFPSPIVP